MRPVFMPLNPDRPTRYHHLPPLLTPLQFHESKLSFTGSKLQIIGHHGYSHTIAGFHHLSCANGVTALRGLMLSVAYCISTSSFSNFSPPSALLQGTQALLDAQYRCWVCPWGLCWHRSCLGEALAGITCSGSTMATPARVHRSSSDRGCRMLGAAMIDRLDRWRDFFWGVGPAVLRQRLRIRHAWEAVEFARLKKAMRRHELKVFIVEDRSHPESEEMYTMLELVGTEMIEAGYIQELACKYASFDHTDNDLSSE